MPAAGENEAPLINVLWIGQEHIVAFAFNYIPTRPVKNASQASLCKHPKV
jgi:hypothetical protein